VPKAVFFLAAVVLLFVAAFFLPVADTLTLLLEWIDRNRAISWLVFIVFYIGATVLLLPGSVLTLGAGFLFGLGYGFAIVSVSSIIGASCAFLLGRFIAREWVQEQLAAMPRFGQLDRAVGNRGFLMVILTRLSPLFPFNLLNYALGITSVRFPHYFFASWIGMVPGTLLYVYLGSVASDLSLLLAGDVPDNSATTAMWYVGLAATAVITILITRIATKVLNANLEGAAK
jgi:uncharacterized membrane protein YdjX (TVP38/TMEM64 family)